MVPGPKPLSRAVDDGRALVPGPKPLGRAVDEGRALVPGPKPLCRAVDEGRALVPESTKFLTNSTIVFIFSLIPQMLLF